MNRLLLLAASFFVLSTVAGCGGGGSGGNSSGTQPPPIVDAKLGGIWEGTIFNENIGSSWQVIGLSLDTGEGRFIDEFGTQYVANLTADGTSFSGTFFGVAPLGETFIDGSVVATGNMSGTISERNRISGSYTVSTGERGSLDLFYNSIYERDSSLSLMAGTWIDADQDAFTVDTQGEIFGQDSSGCVYTGRVSTINRDFNAYRVQLNVSSCGTFNGSYSGLGILDDYQVVSDNRIFIFQVSNDRWALTNLVLKL
jgi:hypothetical protein